MSDERRLEDRIKEFAAKVDKADHDSCWEWKAGKAGNGYGQFWNGHAMIGAHRCSWQFFFGDIPEGKMVLHKCNNRGCVNPYHLYIGDQGDNNRDTVNSGHVGGPLRKLDKKDVEEIHKLLQIGVAQREIGKMFRVSQATIYNVNVERRPYYVRKTVG